MIKIRPAELDEFLRTAPKIRTIAYNNMERWVYFKSECNIPTIDPMGRYSMEEDAFKEWCGISRDERVIMDKDYYSDPEKIPFRENGSSMVTLVSTRQLRDELAKRNSEVVRL